MRCVVFEEKISRKDRTATRVSEQTIYDWLDVVAERDFAALDDLPRPRQSTRFTDEQWTVLTATLAASPSEAGYDDPTWTPALVREHIKEMFGVTGSLAHMYRVMKRAGLSYRQPAHATTKQILSNNSAGVLSSKKWPTLKAAGYRIVVIDQNTQVIKTKQKRGWFPVNSPPETVGLGRSSLNQSVGRDHRRR